MQRGMEDFYSFASRFALKLDTEEALDNALSDYADHMYLNGESNDSGNRLKAALEYERPEAVRRGELRLPKFKKACKGWRKLAPSQTRLPMLEFIKSCISGLMIHQGWRSMALYNEATFSTYARPGEMMKVYAAHLVNKNELYQFSVLVLAPFERNEGSKVGIYDEVLILDDVRAPWLDRLLHQQSLSMMKSQGASASMWDFNAKQFLKYGGPAFNA